jgi:hypothetical protein
MRITLEQAKKIDANFKSQMTWWERNGDLVLGIAVALICISILSILIYGCLKVTI